ncbi:hypothetical protein C8F04DRAFT_213028 [Mycena alexandri]|uniref:PHD-type domain-containing protein n=1 Tax=Mycena alexandri TaxID=1745969 RepID=A0AAD6TKB3_9AGAR|nr:hypothetical protein C8F04DRAFT_213028 [Mycena alexandri]
MPRCLVCLDDSQGDVYNFLLTCDQCQRSWHHRCHAPPISQATMSKLWTDFLGSKSSKLAWMCPKCTRRKAAAAVNEPLAPALATEIMVLDESVSTRRVRESRSAEIIDLTESPEARKPSSKRVPSASADVAEIIDLAPPATPPATPTPAASRTRTPTDVIDLSFDSPELAPQQLPEPAPVGHPLAVHLPQLAVQRLPEPAPVEHPLAAHLPQLAVHKLPESTPVEHPLAGLLPEPVTIPGVIDPTVLTDHPLMEVYPDTLREPPISRSPSLSALVIPDPPSRSSTPSTIVRFQSMMDVDDVDQKPIIDQKPLALLLEKLTVSEPPRGGTLGPAWMRERLEASGQMALWKRIVEKQEMRKPLSRRKLAKTRFMGEMGESFVVLPFVDNKLHS